MTNAPQKNPASRSRNCGKSTVRLADDDVSGGRWQTDDTLELRIAAPRICELTQTRQSGITNDRDRHQDGAHATNLLEGTEMPTFMRLFQPLVYTLLRLVAGFLLFRHGRKTSTPCRKAIPVINRAVFTLRIRRLCENLPQHLAFAPRWDRRCTVVYLG